MFSGSRCKNACKMLADLCPCFHQSLTRPNVGRSRVKVCPILCRLRTKLCPNFCCSRARLCPISFAPCPFPNLAGTLTCLPTCQSRNFKGESKHRYAKSRTYYYDICLYNNGTIYLQNIQTRFVINLIILCSNVCKSPYW